MSLFKRKDKNVKITNMIIRSRVYRGDIGVGTAYLDETEFIIKQLINNPDEKDGIISIVRNIDFCADEIMGDNIPDSFIRDNFEFNHGKIRVEIPFSVSCEELETINEIIDIIKTNPNYKYNESHYSKEGFNIKRYEYYDVIIDGEEFEISVEDEILSELYNEVLGDDCKEIPNKVNDFKTDLSTQLNSRCNGDMVRLNRPIIRKIILELKDKINELQPNTETTIAQILHMSDGFFLKNEPSMQKEVLKGLLKECKKSNIKIDVIEDKNEEKVFNLIIKKLN